MRNTEQYTKLSQDALQPIIQNVSAEEALSWLKTYSSFRTLPEKLQKVYPGSLSEMESVLKAGFKSIHTDPKERDSIRKLIPNWFSKIDGIDDRTVSRNYAFEICFILNLRWETSKELIVSLTGEGIHYRNLDEATMAYCLLNGKTYADYIALIPNVKKAAMTDTGGEAIKYTNIIRHDLEDIHDDAVFLTYIRNNAKSFLETQSTAHAYFLDMIGVLTDEESRMTVREVVEQNLYRRYLPKNKKQGAMIKSICAAWPNETQLYRIKNEQEPVTRKVLILLFLASCGGLSSNPGSAIDDLKKDDWLDAAEDEEDFENDFDGMLIQLNAMLSDCGFSAIDPRHPFDWIVLYCMATGDLFEIDSRFDAILTSLFGNESQA